MVTKNTAEIEFKAKDEVTKAIDRIDKRVKTLGKTVKKDNTKTGKSFLNLGNTISTAFGFTAANAINQAAGALKDFVAEGIKLSIDFERQFQSLELQIGNTANAFVDDLKGATKGLVSDFSLVSNANRALAFGLQKESIPALAETAVVLGKIQGLSPDKAFNDIVTGIARASPLILDNLGIIIDSEKTYGEYAKAIGRSADSLSKYERTLALTQSVIDNSRLKVEVFGLSAELFADKVDRAKASVDNFKTGLGASFTSTIAAAIDPVDTLAQSMSETDVVSENLRKSFLEGASVISSYEKEIKGLSDSISSLNQDISDIGKQKTQEEIDAELEIIRLQRQKLAQQKDAAALGSGAGVFDTPEDARNARAVASQQQGIISGNISSIDKRIADQQRIIDENRLKREETIFVTKKDAGLFEIATNDEIETQLRERISQNDREIFRKNLLVDELLPAELEFAQQVTQEYRDRLEIYEQLAAISLRGGGLNPFIRRQTDPLYSQLNTT